MISFGSSGQKLKFNSANTVGMSTGEAGVFTLFQSVNGFEYKKWFAGIGAGHDGYNYKSYPLFAELRRFLDGKNNFLVYGDFGYNIPGKNSPKEHFQYSSAHFKGGLYGDVGIGHTFKLNKQTSFLVSGGYSYKQLFSNVGVTICPFVGPCYETIYNYKYSFNRLILKAGIIL